MIITIDGPTASGKGSLAKAIAAWKCFYYVDTGSLYRAVGYLVSRSYSQSEVIEGAFWSTRLIDSLVEKLAYHYHEGAAQVLFEGSDITTFLRTPLIDWYASHVSRVPLVRDGLRHMQQDMARHHTIVIDGRDCGTVIFPDASHKFFLTASLAVRVQRALHDSKRHSEESSAAIIRDQIVQRDMRDITRPSSPLRPADDARIIDSTQLTKEETLSFIKTYLQ